MDKGGSILLSVLPFAASGASPDINGVVTQAPIALFAPNAALNIEECLALDRDFRRRQAGLCPSYTMFAEVPDMCSRVGKRAIYRNAEMLGQSIGTGRTF